jgi:hypothetical protein
MVSSATMALEFFPLEFHSGYQSRQERQLKLPPPVQLFGIEEHLAALLRVLALSRPGWLVSIEGLAGIGKTALAGHLLRQKAFVDQFYQIGWVSAKPHTFFPRSGLRQKLSPSLTPETLIDALLEQFDQPIVLTRPAQEKRLILTHLLKGKPYLVVIDNLETWLDYQALLPLLRELANPSKFVLTSRHSLQAYPDVFCCQLRPLNQLATVQLIRAEAWLHKISRLAGATEAELNQIYELVGGYPLALKLVIGQMAVKPLPFVLDRLRQTQPKNLGDRYTYIYWQSWQSLSEAARRALLAMPLADGGSIDQLLALTELDPDQLEPVLEQLIRLALLQIQGEPEVRRYTIHPLTEIFLLHEAIQ